PVSRESAAIPAPPAVPASARLPARNYSTPRSALRVKRTHQLEPKRSQAQPSDTSSLAPHRSSIALVLFSPGETDTCGEGSTLAAGQSAEIGSVDIVHHYVGILPIKGIHHLDARGPQISAKRELLFQRQVQILVIRKAR